MAARGIKGIFPGNTPVRYFSLARYALLEALHLLEIKPGDQILLPSFMCREFLAPIHMSGAKPVYYNVDEKLQPISFPELSSPRAIIAVNFFGFPQNLSSFRDYCAVSGAVLIEDNAHGFLSCDENGHLLGSRGDIGIFSFRKTFPLPDGAALLINDRMLQEILPVPILCSKEPLPRSFVIKQLLRQIQNSTGIRVRTISEQCARIIRRLKTGYALPQSLPDAEQVIPGEPAIHCESLAMLDSIDADRDVARRRELFLRFHTLLGSRELVPVFERLPDGVAPYGYVFRASDQEARSVIEIAAGMGFDCASWPDLPDAVVLTAPDYYKNVWWVNFLC